MDLRRLHQFNTLAETLNFSRAAERLHIAQPALSISIQKLESELGIKLFERTPTGVVLTPAGKLALVDVRRLLHHGEQLKRTVRSAVDGTGGRLRIGFVGSSIFSLIPTLISGFRQRYPDVRLVLTEATSAGIGRMLSEQALDVGIVRTPLVHAFGATVEPLQRDRLLVAMPRDHALAQRDPLSLAELRNEAFIMYSLDSATGLHTAALAACEAAGFAPKIVQEAVQVPTVLALVESGLGVALVPEVTRGHRSPQVIYREVPETVNIETTLALAYLPQSDCPPATRFIDWARAHLVRPGADRGKGSASPACSPH